MNVELIQMTNETALWAVGLTLVTFVILVKLPVEEGLQGAQRLLAHLTGLFGVAVAVIWLLSNYVTPA